MARSLRRRLQVWYALVLCTIIAAFAAVMYRQARATALERADLQLAGGLRYLEGALQSFPPYELEGREPPRRGRRGPPPFRDPERRPRPPGRFPEFAPPAGPPEEDGPGPRDGAQPPIPPEARPGDEPRPPGRPPPPPRDELLARLSLRPRYGDHSANDAENAPGEEGLYFSIWRENGTLLKSDNLPPEASRERPHGAARGIQVGRGLRELIGPGPRGTDIVVGKSMRRETAELRRFAWMLLLSGGSAVALGLVGSWLISGTVLRSIAAISETAASISATQLSRRIDAGAVELELQELATVLNDTFGRLEASFERQRRFSADASHELRTPLAILYTNLQLALARPRSPEEYRETLQAGLVAATRMRTLVEGLLILARTDAGRLELDQKLVELNQVAEEVVAQAAADAAEAGVQLRLERSAVAVSVRGDSALLARVLTNLVANSLRHTPSGGTVRVIVDREGELAVFRVADTGSGIPLEDQPRLFERFFRVDKARARASGGVGLGLAICKSLVEAHGGAISCVSAPGQGSTFTVRLPAAGASHDAAPLREATLSRAPESAANERS